MLNRILFLFTGILSLGLTALVLFAPFLVQDNPAEQPPLLLLFAFDATIRRAAIACALGMLVTAWVFFRSSGQANDRNSSKRSRSANTIGA